MSAHTITRSTPHSNLSLSIMSLTVTTDSRDPTVSLVSRIITNPRVSRHDAVNEMRPRGRQVGQVGQCEVVVSSAMRVGQRGKITQIVVGCDEREDKGVALHR